MKGSKNEKKRISTLLLVLVLVLSLSVNAMAAETNAGAELVLSTAQNADGQTVVSLCLQGGDGVTNGHISVHYDSKLVELVGAKANSDCGLTSVNDKTAGKVTMAWVGSKFSAEKTVLLELTFNQVKDAAGTAVYTAEAVRVYAGSTAVTVKEASVSQQVGPAAKPECPFVDIDGHWAEEDIKKVYDNGLFNGMTDTEFVPNGEMNRAMFVTVLYRVEGKPTVEGKSQFTDVKDTAYYADAVAWAVDAGITNGVSQTEFAPDKALSRQELVTMLQRYAQMKGNNVSGRAALTGYVDSAKVASWAKAPFAWAVKEGIINGYSDDTLRPTDSATRAQVAAILCRYLGL